MSRPLSSLLTALRLLAVTQLALGIIVWTGRPVPWRGVHIGLGVAFAGLVVVLGALVARATGRVGALLASLAWTAFLVAFGISHQRVWPGSAHWVAQALHLLIGLATLGVAERLAAPARRVGVVQGHRR